MAYTWTLFDAPDAGITLGKGTFPLQINDSETCSGIYVDSSNLQHGFIRTSDGTLTEFDVPTATQTFVGGLNSGNVTCGWWIDGSDNDHGFIRAADGTITTFDHPSSIDIQIGLLYIQEAGTGVQLESVGNCINDSGTVCGVWRDVSGFWHGFLRTSGGSYTNFDLSGDYSSGITVSGINNNGDICGNYLVDVMTVTYNKSFIRKADGTIIQFSTPDSGTNLNNGTLAYLINDNGDVSGYYADSSGLLHGFIRMSDGTIVEYDVPGTTSSTLGTCINNSGQCAGWYTNPVSPNHTDGFVRATDGTFTTFDPEDNPTDIILTYPYGINANGCVAGSTLDDTTDDVVHGFIGCPDTPPPPVSRTRCVDTPASGTMFTGQVTRDLDADWSDETTFYITQDVPMPFTLRGLVLRLTYDQD